MWRQEAKDKRGTLKRRSRKRLIMVMARIMIMMRRIMRRMMRRMKMRMMRIKQMVCGVSLAAEAGTQLSALQLH